MKSLFACLALVLPVAALASACSSSSSASASGCANNPFSCGAGQTCWPKDTSGAFSCAPSGKGAKGDSCQNTPGTATCGDNLACLQQTSAGGQCLSYCEPNSATHGCGEGETCRLAQVAGTSTTFYICAGGTTPAKDAGSEASAPQDAASE